VLVGLLFRVAAFAGLALNFTFFLSATWNAFPFYFGSDIVFVMCWLTLLLTGPQQGLSIDALIAERVRALQWLAHRPIQPVTSVERIREPEPPARETTVTLPDRAKLYPRQVAEVNRAFDRIKQQFVAHEETQTVLEFVRAFIISIGVDRTDSPKILTGLENLIKRDTWEQQAK
jgi:hypothetical protein